MDPPMNFRCGSGKKVVFGSKINFKRQKKKKIIIFCKTILLAVRRQSVKITR